MLDFEITKARCPYLMRIGCQHPRSLKSECSGYNCPLTDKQIKELILGQPTEFIPYVEMR